MNDIQKIIEAIMTINSSAKVYVKMNIENTLDAAIIEWLDGTTPISKADIKAKMSALEYKSKRKDEYPKIEELVVALYDSDDKTAIDEKRAAVKLKYPKP